MFIESQRLGELQLSTDNPATAAQLVFKLNTEDHLFNYYTEPICPDGSLFFFDHQYAHIESFERSRLHHDNEVSKHDLEQIESTRIGELLQPMEHGALPLGLIRMPLSLADGPRTYLISFASRKTFWTYYLLGSFARDGLYMEDAKGEIAFDSLGEVRLPGNQISKAFRTTSMLPLRDRYHNRFQIIDPEATDDRVLKARMPGPEVRQMYLERCGGIDTATSEIFINGL